MATRTPLLFLFLILCFPSLAGANDQTIQPLTFKGLYHIGWGGITLGHIVFDAIEKDDKYSSTVTIKTSGLARVFKKHVSTSTASGHVASGKYFPGIFTTDYARKKKDRRTIKVSYDKNGAVNYEYITPPENRAERPAVTPKEKLGSLDPITAVFTMRHKAQEAFAGKKTDFTLPVYEGRRLIELKALVEGEETISTDDKSYKTLKLGLSRTPKAGFTLKEQSDYKEGDPVVNVYFNTDDKRIYPLRLTVELPLGTLLTQLVKECDATEACKPD